jgi:lysozyme
MTLRPPLALVALSAAIALLIGVGGLLATGNWTPWSQRYVQGVDVSHHQGPIDWRALAGSGVRFAYIKATEGSDYVDPAFAANWTEAARAGV